MEEANNESAFIKRETFLNFKEKSISFDGRKNLKQVGCHHVHNLGRLSHGASSCGMQIYHANEPM